MTYLLASASPRRRELLSMIGFGPLEIVPSGADESVAAGLSPAETVKALALLKGEDVLSKRDDDVLVVSADTVVSVNGEILGKPRDKADARRMLSLLSGHTHQVHTGISLMTHEKKVVDVVSADVTFRMLTNDEIEWYIASGEPMDKAGAYGIQGKASLFVSHLNGDYYTVVGLPLCRFSELIREFGITLLPAKAQYDGGTI